MLKSTADPLREDLEKLHKQIRDIELKEAADYREIKAHYHDTIQFDTLGYYSFLKEVPPGSTWQVIHYEDHTALWGGKKGCPEYPILRRTSRNDVYRVNGSPGILLIQVTPVHNTLYTIQFNPYRLTMDEAMAIADQIIRDHKGKV